MKQRIISLPMIALLIVLGMGSANAQATMNEKPALKGYCPVAYHAANKAIKGDSAYASTYEGETYWFAKAGAKKMFDANPKKFLPKYDGYCATAMAMGKRVTSDPTLFTEFKGNTYLFSSEEAKKMFDKKQDMYVKKADKAFMMQKSMKQ